MDVVLATIAITIIEIKKNTEPAKVYKKNLQEAKILLFPPHIPITKYIGINKLSKKILKNPSVEEFINFFEIINLKKNRKSINQS